MVHPVKHSAYSQLCKCLSQKTLSLILPGWGGLLKMLKSKNFTTSYSDVHTTFRNGLTKPFLSQRERKLITSIEDITALQDFKVK